MTKIEIINEVSALYITHPEKRGKRCSVNKKSIFCCYFALETGNKCAVGHCMVNPLSTYKGTISYLMDYDENDHLSCRVPFSQDLFKPEYQGHDVEFWGELQRFHDHSRHWYPDNQGITSVGNEFLLKLLHKHANE